MKKVFLKNIIVILSLCALIAGSLSLSGCAYLLYEEHELSEHVKPLAPVEDVTGGPVQEPTEEPAPEPTEAPVIYGESYDSKDEVALYIYLYGELPENYITKSEARKLGWEGGSVERYAPGKCIGGDRYGNYEGILPDDNEYKECDIDTLGKSSRGAKRIVFSEDGDIYYTDDHYESFEVLYGEELP